MNGGHPSELRPRDVLVRLESIADRINDPAAYEIDPEDEQAILRAVDHELDALAYEVRRA